MTDEQVKNLIIVNLFYFGCTVAYCALHAGPLNILVFILMLVLANFCAFWLR